MRRKPCRDHFTFPPHFRYETKSNKDPFYAANSLTAMGYTWYMSRPRLGTVAKRRNGEMAKRRNGGTAKKWREIRANKIQSVGREQRGCNRRHMFERTFKVIDITRLAWLFGKRSTRRLRDVDLGNNEILWGITGWPNHELTTEITHIALATFYCSSTRILGNSTLGKDGRKGGQMIRAKTRKTSRAQKFLS